MHFGYHGGKCCGIKVIYRFNSHPNDQCFKIAAVEGEQTKDDRGASVSSSDRFFHDEAPTEGGEKRLARYIEYAKKHRPSGIIEIVLANYRSNTPSSQISDVWAETLEKHGFYEVNRCLNSNSGNTCVIWHLNMVAGKVQFKKKVEENAAEYSD